MSFGKHLFGAVTAIALLAGPSNAQDFGTVVAEVNGTQITLAHVLAVKDQLPQQYQTLPQEVLFDGIIDQLINQTLLMQSLSELPGWLDVTVENDRRNLLATVVAEQVEAKAVTEDALRAAYDAAFINGDQPDVQEYNASHILVATEDEAKTLVEQLAGGADFVALAAEFSTGPSGPNGGNLGWFGAGQMVPEFEMAVVALDVGAVSDPVQTQFGWHVITLNDSRPVAPPPFEQVRGELATQLQNAAVEARVQDLRAAGTVVRNPDGLAPSVLSDLSLDDM